MTTPACFSCFALGVVTRLFFGSIVATIVSLLIPADPTPAPEDF